MKQSNDPQLTSALLDQDSSKERVVSIHTSESKAILQAAQIIQDSLHREAALGDEKIDRQRLMERIASAKKGNRRIPYAEIILLLLVGIALGMAFHKRVEHLVAEKLTALAGDISGFTSNSN